MHRNKWFMGASAAILAVAALAVACGGDDDDDDSAAAPVDAAAALAKVPAPGDPAPAGSKVFVGENSEDTTSFGLLVLADGTAIAYECDGNETWTWYTGSADGDEVSLTSADGKKLTAEIDGSKATIDGAADYELETANANRAGLYRLAQAHDGKTQTAGWIVANDGSSRGGFSLAAGAVTTRIGAEFDPKRLAEIEALPEFPDIKRAIPGWPAIPSDLTVFSAGGGLCSRIATKLVGTTTTTNTPNTLGNRARLGALERLGCKEVGLFAPI